MSQTITLTVPDRVFQPIQRVAEATDQPIEALLLTALEASLPPLEGLAPELIDELTELERLDDQALWRVMAETVPLQNEGKSKTCCDATAPARSWKPSGSNCPCCNDRPI